MVQHKQPRRSSRISTILALACACVGTSWGQATSPDLARRPNAAQALNELTPSAPAAPASGSSAGPTPPDLSAVTASPRFPIRRFVLEGADSLPASDLDKATRGLTGERRGFSDIEAAVQAVVDAYAQAGIHAVNVQIPEQTLEDGIVRLEVTEKKVQKVETQGLKSRSMANLRRAMPSLVEGEVPNDDVLAREIRLANENPARQMQVTFRIEEDDETLTGVLRVADRPPVSGQFSLDNTGNASTGQWRFGTALQHANLLDRDIVGALQVQTSPGHVGDVKVISGSLRAPWYRAGWMVEWSALTSSVDSGVLQTSAGSYGVLSKGGQWGLKATRLLDRAAGWEPRITWAYDVRRVDSRVTPVNGGTNLTPSIELHPLSVTASALQADDALTLSVLGTLTHNLPGAGRSATSVFAEPGMRAQANPHYTLAKAQVSARWPAGKGFVILSWNGQWTRDALLSAEQFSVGGDASVRGFNGRVASADKGHRIGLEWQSPMAAGFGVEGLQLGWSAFADAGQVWRNALSAGDIPRTTLTSVGLGLRANHLEGLNVRADAGIVTRGQGLAPKGQVFVHVGASYGF